MGFLDGFFTAPGTAQREAYNRRQGQLPDWFRQFAQTYGGDPAAFAKRLQQDETLRRQAMMAIYQALQSQSDPQALAGLFEATAQQDLNANARRQVGGARGAGITDAGLLAALSTPDALTSARVKAGARAQGRNQARQNQQGALQALGGIGAMNANALGMIGNSAGIVAGQPAPAIGGNPLGGLLGTVAGQLPWDKWIK